MANVSAEQSRSIWMELTPFPSRPPLVGDMTCDVAVVGSGIAGLSTAYELAKAGRRVVVIDRGEIGGGQSARTTGHVSAELDDFYYELIKLRGLDESRRYYQSVAEALDRIETICRVEGIENTYARVDAYLFQVPGDPPQVLDDELEACRQIGFPGVQMVPQAPVPGRDVGPAIRFPNQGRLHILNYLHGLVRAIEANGGQVFADTACTATSEEGDRAVIETEHGTIRAEHAVVCTNSPISDLPVHAKQGPYRTYAISGRVPAGSVPDALVWDAMDAYHYVRIEPLGDGQDALIVGGEDHKSGKEQDQDGRFARLEAWTREHYPSFGEVDQRWSGQVYEPVDYLPFTGLAHGRERTWIHTGDSGEGLSNGVAGSLVLKDLVLTGSSKYADIYDPRRVTGGSITDALKEQGDVVANLAGYLTPGEVGSVDEIEPGHGALVRAGLKKHAAYRDEGGQLHVRSATCTHAGCLVKWNGFERCWDCPCHGSQFDIDGAVLQGPALTPLAEVDAD